MEKDKIALSELMERYEEGSTSLEEEQMLLDYFTNEPSEKTSESLRAQFVYFNNKKNEPLPDALEARLHTIQVNVRLLLRIAAILIACLGIGWFTIHYIYLPELTISTGPAEQTRVALPDGTIVFLNSSSELIYKKNLNDPERVVHLKGEGYFEVYRDTLRPFIIYTGTVTTEVLGTSFNLQYDEGEKFSEINVRSGQVQFGSTKKITISTGEGAIQGLQLDAIQVIKARANADAWKTKVLTFENATMKEVVRDIEKYFSVKIEVTDGSLLACHFTGRFTDPGLEDVLKVVTYSLNLQYTLRDNTYILSGQPCQP